jgi:hypothetical protein
VSGPRIAAEPFFAWYERQLRAIANRGAIGIIPLDTSRQPNGLQAIERGARAVLEARLGIDVRTLWTYLHARDGNGDRLMSRYAVEDMVARAGEDFDTLYPEYDHERAIVLEPDVWCPRCKEMTTPLDGRCLWCNRRVVRPVQRDTGAWLAARAKGSPPLPAREQAPTRVRDPAERRHTGRLLWRRRPARLPQQPHREGRNDLAA